MDLLLLFGAALVLFIVALLALGAWWPGNGNDIVDIDPRARAEAQAKADAEDLEQLAELRRRRRTR